MNRGNPNPKTEHLKATQFKPGQSGNPSGRPKKKPVSERYAESIEMPLPENIRKQLGLKPGATWGDAVAMGTIRSAVKGNQAAAKELREGIEGKAREQIELSVDVNKDVVERLLEARRRVAKKDE
jgi:hypothetical protein